MDDTIHDGVTEWLEFDLDIGFKRYLNLLYYWDDYTTPINNDEYWTYRGDPVFKIIYK